jgi:hypothetical protein
MIRRLFILKLIILINLAGCSQKENTMFLNKIVNDFSRNSYFILINISTSNQVSKCLIENNNLFFYFHQTKGLTKEEYKKYIISILNNNTILSITSDDKKKYGFISINSSAVITETAKRGKTFFLNRYFNDRVLKNGIAEDEKFNIINVLYNWQIASKLDDETGYLFIDK